MVNEDTLATIAATFVSGIIVGIIAEWLRAYLALKEHQTQLRRALYSELLKKLREVLMMGSAYKTAVEQKDIKYLKQVQDFETIYPITPLKEGDKPALPYQELSRLNLAYYLLNGVINVVLKLGNADSIDDAKIEYSKLKPTFTGAVEGISEAFEESADVLEKLDQGELLKEWHDIRPEAKGLTEAL